MKKIKTLTIGISAYNEEGNIGKLIASILKQKESNFILEKIIIACDGCTDKTAEIAKRYAVNLSLIKIINDGERLGKAKRLNYFYKSNKSDVILTLDADVILAHPNVLTEIVKKFNDPKVGLVGGCNLPLSPRNFFEKIIYTWLQVWLDIRRNVNKGNSVHNNLGCISALSYQFAKQVKIPNNIIPDDDFTYFTAVKLKYKFKFSDKAVAYYRTVDNVNDFLTQHSRLLYSKKFVANEFGDWVNKYYKTSHSLKCKVIIKSLIKHPLYTTLALVMQIFLRRMLTMKREDYSDGYWKSARSTKILLAHK